MSTSTSSAGSAAGPWRATRRAGLRRKCWAAWTYPWGYAEAAATLLWMIARREGFGDVLAEGVKRAAERLGGDAYQAAVFTMKGATPRGHDHRSRREEMFDTCLSSNATFEIGLAVDPAELDVPALIESFNPVAMPETLSKTFGRRHFEDSIGVCTFTNTVSLATTLGVSTPSRAGTWTLLKQWPRADAPA